MTTTPNPTAEQIERAAETFYEDPAGLTSWTRLNAAEPDIAERYRVAIGRALTAAGVAPQPVIDEAALTEVVFNAVEKWADMYPTPQVSEMIARAVAAWLKDGARTHVDKATQEPKQNETKSAQNLVSLDPEKVAAVIGAAQVIREVGEDGRTSISFASGETIGRALCEAYTEGKLT